jgi:hypothetical protein
MENKPQPTILDANKIWEKIIASLSVKYSISYSGNNPYLLTIGEKTAYFYIRNLTRAYPDHSPNVSRIQLHKSTRLEEIKLSEYPLIPLGYCEQFETVCSWSSSVVKPRLNGKGNVSLYSRFSEMEYDREDIKRYRLKTGDTVSIVGINYTDLLFYDAFVNSEVSFSINKESHEDILFTKIKDCLNEPSDLNAIQRAVDYYSSKGLEYNLNGIRQLIERLRLKVI